MGIAKGALYLLYDTKTVHEFSGSILQLGKQTTYVNPKQILNIGKKFGYLPAVDEINSNAPVDDVNLFKYLGFSNVESLDYSDYESPTHLHDMNLPVPQIFHDNYDVIYDGGTLEHIFNFPQSLINIYNMLKIGGIVIHASPSCNFVDHGFYSFSPTAFYDYYSQNSWEIVKMYLIENKKFHNDFNRPITVYDYIPGSIRKLSMGGWGGIDKLLSVWFVAKKTQHSTCNIIPKQGMYIEKWKNNWSDSFSNKDFWIIEKMRTITEYFTNKNSRIAGLLKTIYNYTPYSQSNYRKKPPIKATYK